MKKNPIIKIDGLGEFRLDEIISISEVHPGSGSELIADYFADFRFKVWSKGVGAPMVFATEGFFLPGTDPDDPHPKEQVEKLRANREEIANAWREYHHPVEVLEKEMD